MGQFRKNNMFQLRVYVSMYIIDDDVALDGTILSSNVRKLQLWENKQQYFLSQIGLITQIVKIKKITLNNHSNASKCSKKKIVFLSFTKQSINVNLDCFSQKIVIRLITI